MATYGGFSYEPLQIPQRPQGQMLLDLLALGGTFAPDSLLGPNTAAGGLFQGALGAIGQLIAEDQHRAATQEQINRVGGGYAARFGHGMDMFGRGAADILGNLEGLRAHQAGGYGGLSDRFRSEVMDPTMGNYSSLWRRYGSQGSRAAKKVSQGYDRLRQDITAQLDRRQGDLDAAYQGRYDKAMGILEGMGAQTRKDINTGAQNLGGQAKSQLAARGLGGSTIAPGMQAAVERQRQDTLGRLDESLRQQRLGAHSQLSGEQLANQRFFDQLRAGVEQGIGGAQLGANERMAQTNIGRLLGIDSAALQARQGLAQQHLGLDENALLRDIGMGRQNVGAYQGLLGQGMGYGSQLSGDLLNFESGVTFGAPPQSPFLQMSQGLGQHTGYEWLQNQYDTGTNWLGLGSMTGAGTLLGLGAGMAIPAIGPWVGMALGGGMGGLMGTASL